MLALSLIKNVRVKYLSIVFLTILLGSSIAKAKGPSTTWEYLEYITFNYSPKMAKKKVKEHKDVLFRFFDILQAETASFYQVDADNLEKVVNCLKKESCEKLEELKHAAQQYRINTLARSVRAFKIMPTYVGHYPAKGTNRVFYNLSSSRGRKEAKFLLDQYKDFQKQSRETFKIMNVKAAEDGVDPVYKTIQEWHTFRYKERHNFFTAEISSLIARYPILPYLSMSSDSVTRKQLLKAANHAWKSRKNVVVDIKSLKKNVKDPLSDGRFELLGFGHILPKALERFNPSEVTMISEFIGYMQSQAHWLNRIYSIVTNYKTLILAACHLFTYSLAPYPHPIVQLVRLGAGFACSAYGAYGAISGVSKSTMGLIRQLSYWRHTRNFDEGVLHQYMANYTATVVMAGIYLKTSLPGLVNRAIDMKSQIGILRGGKVKFSYNSTILKDAGGLAKKYAKYYGEEITINEILFIGGKLQGSVNVVKDSVYKVSMNAFSREFKIFTYTDAVSASIMAAKL